MKEPHWFFGVAHHLQKSGRTTQKVVHSTRILTTKLYNVLWEKLLVLT